MKNLFLEELERCRAEDREEAQSLSSWGYSQQRQSLKPHHLKEFEASAIDISVVKLNAQSLTGKELQQVLSQNKPFYHHNLDAGGWSVKGQIPVVEGAIVQWVTTQYPKVKPDKPLHDKEKGKPIKYLHVPGFKLIPIYYPIIPTHIALQICRRYGLDTSRVDSNGNGWLYLTDIPIIITEGEKKALSLLSQGFLAISVPGIWMGTRKSHDKKHFAYFMMQQSLRSNPEDFSYWLANYSCSLSHKLHPDLKQILPMKGQRDVYICFDSEARPHVRQDINNAQKTLGFALGEKANVLICHLSQEHKGIDDHIVNTPKLDREKFLEDLLCDAIPLNQFRCAARRFKQRAELLKQVDVLEVDSLDKSQIPVDRPLVGMLAPMGFSKTGTATDYLADHREQSVLIPTHRVSLAENLTTRFNQVVDALRQFTNYQQVEGSLAHYDRLVVCADSLMRLADEGKVPKFQILFIDELVQYLNHLLAGSTCREDRPQLLEIFDYFVRTTEQIIGADAHLNWTALDYLARIRSDPVKPLLIYKPDGKPLKQRHVYLYPSNLKGKKANLNKLYQYLREGCCVYICSNSRKTIKAIAKKARQIRSDLAIEQGVVNYEEFWKIREVQGENSGSPESQEFLKNPDKEIEDFTGRVYTLLLSPSGGTGISITSPKFDVTFGIFYPTVHSAEDCAQQLHRVRDTVDMHIWIGGKVIGGKKETNPLVLLNNVIWTKQANLKQIQINDFGEIIETYKDRWVNTWAELIAERNWSINHLASDLPALLREKGYRILAPEIVENSGYDYFIEASKQVTAEYNQAVSSSDLLTEEQYKDLLKLKRTCHYFPPEKEYQLEKYRIYQAYGFEVTEELVELDNCGRYRKAIEKLDDLLAPVDENGNTPHLELQDRWELEGGILPYDLKNRLVKTKFAKLLGLRQLVVKLLSGGNFTKLDSDVRALHQQVIRNLPQVKLLLNQQFQSQVNPCCVALKLLKTLGLEPKRKRVRLKGQRVYQYSLEEEKRQWLLEVLDHRALAREERQKHKEDRVVDLVELELGEELASPEVVLLDPNSPDYSGQLAEIQSWSELALDIETFGWDLPQEGLHPWRGKIRLIQVSNGDKVFVADLGHRMESRGYLTEKLSGFLEVIKTLIESPQVPVIGHNIHFDLLFLATKLGIDKPKNIHCTQTKAQVFFGDYPSGQSNKGKTRQRVMKYGLKDLCHRFTSIKLDKTEQTSDWGAFLSESQISYAARDAWAVYHLNQKLQRLYTNPDEFGFGVLKQEGISQLCRLECESIRAAISMELAGIPIDQNKARETILLIEKAQLSILHDWQKVCPQLSPTQGLKLLNWVNNKFGLNLPSLAKDVVAKHLENPVLLLRSRYLGLNSLLNHLKNLLASSEMVGDGRVHSLYRHLTGSGRFSSGHKDFKELPNVQNIPAPGKAPQVARDFNIPAVRSVVRAGTGKVLGIIDLAAAHARIAADLAIDPAAIEAFADDSVDNHSKVAVYVAKALGKDWSWEYIAKGRKDKNNPHQAMATQCRDTAKGTYYGWLNGAGDKRIQAQIAADTNKTPSLEECKAAISGCEQIYPNLSKFKQIWTSKVNSDWVEVEGKKFAVNRIDRVGARLLLPMFASQEGEDWEASYSEILAGTWSRIEAVAMKRAMLQILDRAETHPEWELKLINYIHDEVNVEVAIARASEAIGAVNKIIGDCFAEVLSHVVDGREKNVDNLIAKSWDEK